MIDIKKEYTYAIIGASNNPDKYGYKVLMDLHGAGYNVIPINQKEEYIHELKVYPTLDKVPKKIDVAVFIIPPLVTEKVLHEVKAAGIDKVWMQPGASSDDAVKFCEENNIDCVYNMCIMVERPKG